MAYGNQLSASPIQRLNKSRPGWEKLGLNYWRGRLVICQLKVLSADNSGAVERAIARRDEAEQAVFELSK